MLPRLAGMFFKVGNLIRNFFDNNWARGKQNYSTTEQQEVFFKYKSYIFQIPVHNFRWRFLPTSPIVLPLKHYSIFSFLQTLVWACAEIRVSSKYLIYLHHIIGLADELALGEHIKNHEVNSHYSWLLSSWFFKLVQF